MLNKSSGGTSLKSSVVHPELFIPDPDPSSEKVLDLDSNPDHISKTF
jgi:hypothetical protein